MSSTPGSDLKSKPRIREWLEKQTDIKTITDLGPGAATYPKLMGGNYVWKAVEIWAPYIEKFQLSKYYDEIRVGDIRYMELPDADCCIAGDVLEHLNREDAIKTFKKIDKQFKHVIISMPVRLLSDDVFEGNYFEKHLSYWSPEELDSMIGPNYQKFYADPCMVYIK